MLAVLRNQNHVYLAGFSKAKPKVSSGDDSDDETDLGSIFNRASKKRSQRAKLPNEHGDATTSSRPLNVQARPGSLKNSPCGAGVSSESGLSDADGWVRSGDASVQQAVPRPILLIEERYSWRKRATALTPGYLTIHAVQVCCCVQKTTHRCTKLNSWYIIMH